MPDEGLTQEEKHILLRIARQALEDSVNERPLATLDLEALPEALRQTGACFVTLTIHKQLRGCIGTLEAYQPLAEDVRAHAVDAALHDYRFASVQPKELNSIEIEISRLTKPVPLSYTTPQELLEHLRPNVDGVILRDGQRRATFLPQVWEKLPTPSVFLNHLCEKMGAPADLWRKKTLQVSIYQVEEFHE